MTRRRPRRSPCVAVAARGVRRPQQSSSAPVAPICARAAAHTSEHPSCRRHSSAAPVPFPVKSQHVFVRALTGEGASASDAQRRQRGGRRGKGHQRQLRAGKLRGAEATQRQHTVIDDSGGGRAHRWDHAGVPASILEGAEATNKSRRRGVLRARQRRRGATKSGRALATQRQRTVVGDGGGVRAGCWDHNDVPVLIAGDEGGDARATADRGRIRRASGIASTGG